MMQDVHDASAQNKFKVISTFARSGGSSTGYRLVGGKILCINEFVEEAQNTYRRKLSRHTNLARRYKTIVWSRLFGCNCIGVGEVDILDGSPPCSAFLSLVSCHNQLVVNTLMVGVIKKYSDGKMVENIEDLFFEFFELQMRLDQK